MRRFLYASKNNCRVPQGLEDKVEECGSRAAAIPHNASKSTGSYVYDEPKTMDDPRVLPFGKVAPIAFSEVIGELRQIARFDVPEEDG